MRPGCVGKKQDGDGVCNKLFSYADADGELEPRAQAHV
jgi:hypothetical protein